MENNDTVESASIEAEIAELKQRVVELEATVDRLIEYSQSPFSFAPVRITNAVSKKWS